MAFSLLNSGCNHSWGVRSHPDNNFFINMYCSTRAIRPANKVFALCTRGSTQGFLPSSPAIRHLTVNTRSLNSPGSIPPIVKKQVSSTGGFSSSPFVGASKVLTLAVSSSLTGVFLKKPVYCQGLTNQSIGVNSVVDSLESLENEVGVKANSNKKLVHKGEIAFGTVIGLCVGYLVKQAGKLVALVIGTGFMFMQYLSYNGFITVNWDRIENSYKQKLDVDKDGRVTTRDLTSKWRKFINFLTYNLQFKTTFLAGFYAGIRYG
ncbi:FUN14 family-domain-containing protein [Phycomyces nitens]|nr:FUN14 family-domain-containing protein [Phycomyces nitens]